MMIKRCTVNIGKNGVNDNFIELLKSAFKTHENVRICVLKSGGRDREQITKEQGIFITTAGMMDGGPVISYLKSLHRDQKNSIILTGYQAEGTNGRLLMEEHAVFIDGAKMKVKAEHKQFDFSAHAGLSDLKEYVNAIKPKKIALNHGDVGSEDNLAKELRNQGYEVFTPKLNDVINF